MPFLNFGSNKNKYCKDDKANKKELRKLKDPISSYPIAIKEVARLLQAMPPTQVSVERLFSALKLQKSDLRNRIKADALDALLLLKANSIIFFISLFGIEYIYITYLLSSTNFNNVVGCLFQWRGEIIIIEKYSKYSDPNPDPLFPNVDPRIRIRIHYYGKVDLRIRIRIHFYQMWIPGSESGSTSKWDGSETLVITRQYLEFESIWYQQFSIFLV